MSSLINKYNKIKLQENIFKVVPDCNFPEEKPKMGKIIEIMIVDLLWPIWAFFSCQSFDCWSLLFGFGLNLLIGELSTSFCFIILFY